MLPPLPGAAEKNKNIFITVKWGYTYLGYLIF
jgi:hypothetical protein